MSKRNSELIKVKDFVEDIVIKLLETVVRDHKGNVVCFSSKSIDVYNKCYNSFKEKMESSDFLTKEEKQEFIDKFNEVQDNLPYLQ